MRRTLLIALFAGAAALPLPLVAQMHLEVHADAGYSVVNARDWLGAGAFDVDHLAWGGDVQLLFGRRFGRGLQIGLEGGYQHVLDYKYVVAGQPTPFTAEAYRVGLTTRFWFGEGLWFGEAGFGQYFFNGRRDPSIIGGAGTLFGIADGIDLPVRVRSAVVFTTGSQIIPVWLSAGLSIRLRD